MFQQRFRLLRIAKILVFMSVLVLSITLYPVTAARAASVPTGLHVVGNKIEDGSGRVINPHGVDHMGSEYSCPNGNTFDEPVPMNRERNVATSLWFSLLISTEVQVPFELAPL